MRPNLLLCITLGLYFITHPTLLKADKNDLTQNHEMVLELNNVDISTFIESVGKITKRNFVIDPRVRGDITILTPQPVTDIELDTLFAAILDVHGLKIEDNGLLVKILPKDSERKMGVFTDPDTSRPQHTLVTEIIPIEHAQVSNLEAMLNPMLSPNGRISVDEVHNKLIVSDEYRWLANLKHIISKLDQPNNTTIKIIKLKHASAEEIVATLQALMESDSTTPYNKGASIITDIRSNSIILKGHKEAVTKYQALTASLDTPKEDTKAIITRVLYLNYAKAELLAPIIEKLMASSPSIDQSESQKQISIQPETNSNALTMMGTADLLEQAETLVKELDIRRAQVLVEAIIAEISTSKASELGLQWALGEGKAAAVSNFGGTGPSIMQLQSNPNAIGNGLTMGLGSLSEGSVDFALLLQALAKDAQINIISTPLLLTLDNTAAEIVVGQNVPFVTGQYAAKSGDADSTPFQTIKRHDIGLTLKITPQVNQGNAIQMNIEQEISSINAQSNNASDIVTNKRSIKTQVIANNQQLIVLGGLVDDSLQETAEKIPLLGDLPILGGLFKSRKTQFVKRNLVVFMRPTILLDSEATTEHSNNKYKSFLDLQKQQANTISLLPNESRTTLESIATNIRHKALAEIQEPEVITHLQK